MGAGDEEEHAILLHNYLLYLATSNSVDRSVAEIYIVLGKAIPEGDKTVYVLLRLDAVKMCNI